MNENNYPKWVQRGPDIGAVLCRNAKEEKDLMDAWDEEQLAKAEEATAEAEADAAKAKEVATLKLDTGKRK